MNVLIYGARRCGKTTEMIKWLKHLNLPVVWQGREIGKRYFEEAYGYKTVDKFGRRDYVTVCDNLESNPGFRPDLYHNIVTCTPDTHRKKPTSHASEFFEWAVASHWAIVWVGGMSACPYISPNSVLDSLAQMSPEYTLGQVHGKWYDPRDDQIKELRETKASI